MAESSERREGGSWVFCPDRWHGFRRELLEKLPDYQK